METTSPEKTSLEKLIAYLLENDPQGILDNCPHELTPPQLYTACDEDIDETLKQGSGREDVFLYLLENQHTCLLEATSHLIEDHQFSLLLEKYPQECLEQFPERIPEEQRKALIREFPLTAAQSVPLELDAQQIQEVCNEDPETAIIYLRNQLSAEQLQELAAKQPKHALRLYPDKLGEEFLRDVFIPKFDELRSYADQLNNEQIEYLYVHHALWLEKNVPHWARARERQQQSRNPAIPRALRVNESGETPEAPARKSSVVRTYMIPLILFLLGLILGACFK